MNKPLISLIGLFLLLLGLCLSAGAEDVIWHPRTPAGGGGIGTDSVSYTHLTLPTN